MVHNEITLDEDVLSFITESRELLEEVEPQLVRLGDRLDENIPADEETVNLIFRAFHTIKGTAAFYQFDHVVSVTHKAETLLEFFRRGAAEINASCTDLLCQAGDVAEKLFKQIETTGNDRGIDDEVRSILLRLNGRIHNILAVVGELDGLDKVIQQREASYELLSPLEEGGPKRIGENSRIFIAESRDVLADIESGFVHIRRLGETESLVDQEVIEKGIESINILAETASFLDYEKVMKMLQMTSELLEVVVANGYVMSSIQIDVFIKNCETIKRMFENIEKKGVDEEIEKDGLAIDLTIAGKADFKPVPEFEENSAMLKKKIRLDDVTDDESPVQEFEVTDQMKKIFREDSLKFVEKLESILLDLKEDIASKEAVAEAFRLIHTFKGSCGIMGYAFLEQLAHKMESLFEAAKSNVLVFDDWDLKAIWFVVGVIGNTIAEIDEAGTGKIQNIGVFFQLLDYISSYIDREKKEAEIHLPEIEKERKNDFWGDIKELRFETIKAGEALLTETVQLDDPDDSPEIPYGFKKRISERRDIRVNIEKLDELINLIGELVIAENMVVSSPDVINRELENFERASVHLSKVVRDLQDVALAVRMIPILGVFRKMIRLVHDLSVKSGKKISLKFYGEDTEIDKTVAELIADPLVHLVRNAIDHGIEKNNDPSYEKNDGEIILESRHEGGEVWVIVKDNGKGLDREKLLFKGIELGIVEGDGSGLSDQEVNELIFHPGFSTSEYVTAVSGRGVGMDVVKKNLEKIKGHINVYSRKGVGTTFVLRIPLTLAIIEGMLVRVGTGSYTIPLLSIRESLQVGPDNVTITMDGQEMVHVRDELIPIIRIHELYNIESEYKEIHEGILVVVEHQRKTAGLFVDSIIGEQQTVIKGLSGYMENLKGISGCTILGDGEVSLILDVGGLIQRTCLAGE